MGAVNSNEDIESNENRDESPSENGSAFWFHRATCKMDDLVKTKWNDY